MSERFHPDIKIYNGGISSDHKKICELLADEISRGLPEAESKIWHAHPVSFLEGNPIVGYSNSRSLS